MKPGTKNQVKGTIRELKGTAKEAAGNAVGNDRLVVRGKVEKTLGKVQNKAGDLEKRLRK